MRDGNSTDKADTLVTYADVIRTATTSDGTLTAVFRFGPDTIDACIRDLAEEVRMLRATHLASGEYWTDHHGVIRRVPRITGRLHFKNPGHAAIRAFVFQRDGFQCQVCGVSGKVVPDDYDGRESISVDGPGFCLVADHMVSRHLGGSHHPANLQTLCDNCNSRKGSSSDAEFREKVARRKRRDAKVSARMEAFHGVR